MEYYNDKLKMLQSIYANNISQVSSALKKMELFLVDKGVIDSAKDVKKMCRIEVKGIADNGKERLVQKEVEEKFGTEVLEDSDAYGSLYPVFDSGVIVCKTENEGTYYSQYDVVKETEDTFDLQIREYRFFNNTFYINFVVYIEGINKIRPIGDTKFAYANGNAFFRNVITDDELKKFTNSELQAIQRAFTEANDTANFEAISSYTLSTFRIVNFLKEYFSKENGQEKIQPAFYDNEYYIIKNWDGESDSTNKIYETACDETYLADILKTNNSFKILKTNTILPVINGIVKQTEINTFYAAVGFAFRSGLNMMNPVFEMIRKKKGVCELIVGSLQKYDDVNANNKIDRGTVNFVNELIQNKDAQFYTYKPSFFHGKFYYLCNEEKAFIIVGSSNISKTAFNENYEMDVIHIVDKGSEQDVAFLDWYSNLKSKCEKLDGLVADNFSDFNWASELDAYQAIKNQQVSKETFMKKIEQLSDEETKIRLRLWRDKNPTYIYENIKVESLKDYIMLVYGQNKLVVFESFIPGNAYYVFRYKNDLAGLLSSISQMTKTQMTLSIHYVSRGYHSHIKEKLAQRINKFFE